MAFIGRDERKIIWRHHIPENNSRVRYLRADLTPEKQGRRIMDVSKHLFVIVHVSKDLAGSLITILIIVVDSGPEVKIMWLVCSKKYLALAVQRCLTFETLLVMDQHRAH